MEFFQTGHGDSTRIIGVMGDFHFRDFSLKIEATELKRFSWGPPSYLSVKIVGSDIQSVLDHIQTTLASISERYPFRYTFYDERVYAKTFISEAKELPQTDDHIRRCCDSYCGAGIVWPHTPHGEPADERDRYPEDTRRRFVVDHQTAFGKIWITDT